MAKKKMFIYRYCITQIIFVVFISLPQVAISDGDVNGSGNKTTMDRLHIHLFTSYDKTAHPMFNQTQRTDVALGMQVKYIDIDELEGKITVYAWINMAWKNERLSWNSDNFDNISLLRIRAKDVWTPDLTLYNSAGKDAEYVGDTQVLLYGDGSFVSVPPVVYTAYCKLNLRMWPYDTQTCKLKVGTWSLTKIKTTHLDVNQDDFEDGPKSPEWEVTDIRGKYVSEEFHNYIEYTIKVKRCSDMYSAVIITPASCIIFLCQSIFWLPPQAGEKILLNAVVIVIITAYLMYFAQMLPILAENTPLVVLFFSASLLLLSLSTVISVIVLYFSTTKHKQRIPNFVKKLLYGTLGKIILLGQFTLEAEPNSLLYNGIKETVDHTYKRLDQEMSASDQTVFTSTASSSNRSVQFDWILLATTLDRICFILYSLIFIVLTIVYSV